MVFWFWSCRKNSLIRKIGFKISKFITSQPGWQRIKIHILPNISQGKCNQTLKFGQVKEYNKRNIFLQISCTKWGRETSSRPLLFYKKTFYEVNASILRLFQSISIVLNLANNKSKIFKTLEYWFRDMLNFDFSKRVWE